MTRRRARPESANIFFFSFFPEQGKTSSFHFSSFIPATPLAGASKVLGLRVPEQRDGQARGRADAGQVPLAFPLAAAALVLALLASSFSAALAAIVVLIAS